MGDRAASGEEQVRRFYADAEAQTARAFEEVVKRDAFGELLARLTENLMGITRISNDTFDLMVRNLRLAGRRDVTRLAEQLARTEDKLEMVLQEIERLRDERDGAQPAARRGGRASSSNGSGTTKRRSTRSRS
jgi:hypothetical protein